MARSFWKGKNFIKEFVLPAYTINGLNQLKWKNLQPAQASHKILLDIKAQRRNHIFLKSQQQILQTLSPYYLYTGYDFISQALPKINLEETHTADLNLGARIPTRELEVVHKVKLSKAARKNKAKLVKKKSFVLTKSTTASLSKKKMVITKKIKK